MLRPACVYGGAGRDSGMRHVYINAWLPWVALALLLVVSMVTAPSAVAQEQRVTVRLDGRAVFRVGGIAELDANTRARQIERRLLTLLDNPAAIAPARVEPSNTNPSERIVSVAGVPVVTVSEVDAQDNVTDVDPLAVQWAQAIDGALSRGRAQRLSPWGRFTGEVRASITTAFARLGESAITIIPRALAALLVIGLFGMLASGVRRLLRALFRRVIADRTTENLIRQLNYYAIWALGLLVAVDALGFDPQTVVTGLGLTGLALGFALKDIISNFVSGLLILALRPFELGDQIIVGETEGSVQRIDLRATQIRTYDGRIVLVPNGEVFTSRVINNTAAPLRRASVVVPISYATDLPQALVVVRDAVAVAEGVLPEPPPSVRVRELGLGDVLIEARFWTDSRRSDVVATISTVNTAIVAAMHAARLPLPDPGARTITPANAAAWRDVLEQNQHECVPEAHDAALERPRK